MKKGDPLRKKHDGPTTVEAVEVRFREIIEQYKRKGGGADGGEAEKSD